MHTKTIRYCLLVGRLQCHFVIFDTIVAISISFIAIVAIGDIASRQYLGSAKSATDAFDGQIPLFGIVTWIGEEEEAVDTFTGAGSLFSVIKNNNKLRGKSERVSKRA